MNNYTSDDWTIDEAREKADIIAIGKILRLGRMQPEGAGLVYFDSTVIKIVDFEKGETDQRQLTISYQVKSFQNNKIQEMPEEGGSYRFYITVRNNGTFLKASKVTDI